MNKHYLSPVTSITRDLIERAGHFAADYTCYLELPMFSRCCYRVNNLKAVIIITLLSEEETALYSQAEIRNPSVQPLSLFLNELKFLQSINPQSLPPRREISYSGFRCHVHESCRFRGAHLVRQKYDRVNQTTPFGHLGHFSRSRTRCKCGTIDISNGCFVGQPPTIYSAALEKLFASASKFVAFPLRCDAP